MKKEQNLATILELKNYQINENDGVIIWDSKNKHKIRTKFKSLNNLEGLSNYGERYIVPSWFYLLSDNDLFNDFIEHPQSDLILNSEIQELNKISNDDQKMLLSDIIHYPFFFNYDVKKLLKLREKGVIVDEKIFINLINNDKYLLDLLENQVLPFDEYKVLNAGSQFTRYNEKNSSIISIMIADIEGLDNIDEKILDTYNAIQRLIILGANPKCYYHNKMGGFKEIEQSYSIEEYAEKYAPRFFKRYQLIKLEKQLVEDLKEKESKKRNKI